ncbi:MAG: N-acetylneuraminate synthase family protein [Flavobacteriaceae bacterium]|nr:N-acetylneuraminate synthase family protein [Flavobacteriaceae bacterium]
MKTRAIVQARMLSTRLRGKSLMSVTGIPILYRVVENIKKIDFIDEIVIATTSLEADKPIVSAAHALNVKVYQGSSLNVLDRYIKASSDMNDDDLIVRFTADNPIVIKSIAEELHEKAKNKDYVAIENLSHLVPEFIKVNALRKVKEISDDPIDIEHVTPFFRRKEGKSLFDVELLPNDYSSLRPELDKYLTIDTGKDLVRLEKVFDGIKKENDLDEIYSFIDHNINTGLESEVPTVNLDGTVLGEGFPTYIIAEIGQNHNGSIDLAKKLIDMSKRCGASAVKFQKRDIPSELTKEAFDRVYDNPNSFGRTYGEHRMFLELSEEAHKELKEYCDLIGMTYFCTPCDVPSVELLERIGCPFFKVASRDLTNIPLLEKLGSIGKPVIISTGMASIEDIDVAIETLQLPKNKLVITQCTSQYPCDVRNVNLRVMATLRDKYKVNVGLSDHTSGVIISSAAAAIGAPVIEKHVSLDRTMKGTDQPGSLEESGLHKLVDYIRAIELAMGSDLKEINPATKAAKEKLARSVTSKRDIKKGEVLTDDMLCLKSPGTGIKWNDREIILNKKALLDIPADVTLETSNFE